MARAKRVAAAAAVAAGCLGLCGPAAADGGIFGRGSDRPGLQARTNNAYDPCWPERYNAVARQEVLAPFAAQALNGHIMNQTLWNYHFEPGTDRLTAAGVEKLDSLVRVRPHPDTKIYLQTARDIGVNLDALDKLADSRFDLDSRRAALVQKYLAAQPRPMPYEIYVHDPSDNSINSTAAGNAFRGQLQGYRGGITSGGGGSVTGSGGGNAPGAGNTGASTVPPVATR